MGLLKCLGGCLYLFLVAIVFDIIGLILLLIGIFANLHIDGRFYGDFLIYSGSLLIFFSLGCWLMWYVGNIPVSEDDGLEKTSSIVMLARALSTKLSQKLNGEESMKCVEDDDCSQGGSLPRKASRVTWGRSTVYHNEGYDGSLDSISVEKEKGEKQDI